MGPTTEAISQTRLDEEGGITPETGTTEDTPLVCPRPTGRPVRESVLKSRLSPRSTSMETTVILPTVQTGHPEVEPESNPIPVVGTPG